MHSAIRNTQKVDIIQESMQKGYHMRRKFSPQLHLFTSASNNAICRELAGIYEILDANSQLLDLVYQDLVRAKHHDTGREGLTAEQVLWCCPEAVSSAQLGGVGLSPG